MSNGRLPNQMLQRAYVCDAPEVPKIPMAPGMVPPPEIKRPSGPIKKCQEIIIPSDGDCLFNSVALGMIGLIYDGNLDLLDKTKVSDANLSSLAEAISQQYDDIIKCFDSYLPNPLLLSVREDIVALRGVLESFPAKKHQNPSTVVTNFFTKIQQLIRSSDTRSPEENQVILSALMYVIGGGLRAVRAGHKFPLSREQIDFQKMISVHKTPDVNWGDMNDAKNLGNLFGFTVDQYERCSAKKESGDSKFEGFNAVSYPFVPAHKDETPYISLSHHWATSTEGHHFNLVYNLDSENDKLWDKLPALDNKNDLTNERAKQRAPKYQSNDAKRDVTHAGAAASSAAPAPLPLRSMHQPPSSSSSAESVEATLPKAGESELKQPAPSSASSAAPAPSSAPSAAPYPAPPSAAAPYPAPSSSSSAALGSSITPSSPHSSRKRMGSARTPSLLEKVDIFLRDDKSVIIPKVILTR